MGSKDNDCHGLECQVVSYKHSGDETSCCNNTNFCGVERSCCKGPFGSGTSCVDKCRGFAKKVDGNICMEQECKLIGGTTGIAELSSHYNPSKFPSKDNDCHGLECQVVSYKPVLIVDENGEK